VYYGYDTHGNVSEVSKENDERFSYIWDYNKTFAIAKVQNASPSTIAYTSFEADGTGGWTLAGTRIDTCGLTGRKSFNGTVSKTVSSGNYTVSLWSKTSATVTVNSTSGTLINTIGNWKLLEWNLTASSISVTGTCFDELRLYPVGTFMTTYCYEPQVGVTAQCDINNRLVYYEYDGLGRLMLVRDQEKNVLKKLCYNYAGHAEACSVYYNTDTCQSFTRNNCGTDSAGTAVTYCVPANRYSGYSQADANAKAVQELAALGPANANSKGSCVLVCTSNNCTGEGKKCIAGICETGVKVCIGSEQVHGSLYLITYHYDFSDGTFSQNYTEYSSSPCITES
jgi:hypothetical protein